MYGAKMVNRDRLRAAALTRNVQIWIDQLQASYGEPACRKPAWLAAQASSNAAQAAGWRRLAGA